MYVQTLVVDDASSWWCDLCSDELHVPMSQLVRPTSHTSKVPEQGTNLLLQ
jgi:hypothetical protein